VRHSHQVREAGDIALRVRTPRKRVKYYVPAVPLPPLLRELLTAPGPSGYEAAPSDVWRAAAEQFATVSSDALGSSVARVAGTGKGPLLAVIGHIDEIGLVVTHIDDDGLVYFRPIGGWSPEVLLAQRIEVSTRNGVVTGVVERPRRKQKKGETPPPLDLDELFADIGARDGDEARSRVRPGDPAVIAGEPVELPNERLVSRALDNRLGAYVALEAARRVAEAGGVAGDVAAVAAVQEEVGDFGGARTTAFALEPQIALAVDVTWATDVPGADAKEMGEHKLGSGPAISRGSTINPLVFELLAETAEEESIPYTIEVSTGTTSTDMDAVYLSRAGLATGLVSIPLRYMHTPTEMVALEDVENVIRLIVAFARRLDAATSFTR
jgi:putative aminopeptidase FrvX